MPVLTDAQWVKFEAAIAAANIRGARSHLKALCQNQEAPRLQLHGSNEGTYAFDTLGYSKRLRETAILIEQADARAEAAREFIMAELVTKADLTLALDHASLKLTVRLGAMLALGVAVLATIIKL